MVRRELRLDPASKLAGDVEMLARARELAVDAQSQRAASAAGPTRDEVIAAARTARARSA